MRPAGWSYIAFPHRKKNSHQYRDLMRYQFYQSFCTWEKQGKSWERPNEELPSTLQYNIQLSVGYKETQKHEKELFNPYRVSRRHCTHSLPVKPGFIKDTSSFLICFATVKWGSLQNFGIMPLGKNNNCILGRKYACKEVSGWKKNLHISFENWCQYNYNSISQDSVQQSFFI